jgi:C-terminal region of eIF3h
VFDTSACPGTAPSDPCASTRHGTCSQPVHALTYTRPALQENQVRKQNGEEPLPEDDPVQFKPLEPLSLVTSYLLQQQVASTCGSADSAASELLHKLQISDCLRL